MEASLLLSIHRLATPALDSLFLVSNALGLFVPCATLVLGAAAWHLARGERYEALTWIGLGVLTWLLPEALKPVVARPRPQLWPRLIEVSGFAFPSGHATAGAALYPLLGWVLCRGKKRGRLGVAVGALVGGFVGFGRLYLGVHWPTDVLAGWALGAALSGVAMARLSLPRRGAGPCGVIGSDRSQDMEPRSLTLVQVAGHFAVCRLAAEEPVPAWAMGGAFVSVTRTEAELSIVCAEDALPAGVQAEKGWRCLRVRGPLGFGMTGILASIALPLAGSGVSIFVVSTYDTDYLLVQDRDLERAKDALERAGHSVER